MSVALGFDTSNYTTSCACYDGREGENFSKLLEVRPGELGLRQSDALFQHVKRLPELSDRLFAHIGSASVLAVGVSSRPRALEGSYMPCFLAGETAASVAAQALGVPLYRYSHQQGHIAAALCSAKRLDLLDKPFLTWHLSGGTTELLLVQPGQEILSCKIIGGTSDISAGQLIDRTGKLLGFDFPAGKALDEAALLGDPGHVFPLRVQNCSFSFSGMQNQAETFFRKSGNTADTAAFTLCTIAAGVRKATEQARDVYGDLPVVFSGGVASSLLLRSELKDLNPVFAHPRYSTDNALGPAVLAYLQVML